MARVLVLHTETGVRCGFFVSSDLAQNWLDQLGVTPEYKERCYKIVDESTYWQRFAIAR